VVLSNSPTLVSPALGTPASGVVTNLTGTASININGTVGATTPAAGAFTTLSATGAVTFAAGTAALPSITTSGDTNTGVYFPAADTVGITAGGTERMRVDSAGRLLSNQTASYLTQVGNSSGWAPNLQVSQTSSSNIGLGVYSWSNYSATDVGGGLGLADFVISHSNNNTPGSHTAVLNGMVLGRISLSGSDGTNFVCGAFISGAADGQTWASGDCPGRLVFGTTADGAAVPTERMRIDSSGNVGIGTSSPTTKLAVTGTLSATGNATLSGATAELQFTGATYGWVRATVGDLYLDAPTAKSIYLRNAGTNIATVSSTGLAVTGALSATGAIVATETTPSLRLILNNTTPVTGKSIELNSYSDGSLFIGQTGIANWANFSSTGLAVTGALSATGVATFAAGTAALPSITTSGDTNTGIYFPAADTIAFTEGGAEAMRINSSGIVLVGTASATGTNLLQVNSDIRVNGFTLGKGASSVATNTGFGLNVLSAITTGGYNTAIGYVAGTFTSGTNNTAIGYGAYGATTGSSNTAVGALSLFSNTSGESNTAVGSGALRENISGAENTAVGSGTLTNNTGSYNSALGRYALANNTTGTNNTASGYRALYNNTTASNNTASGYQALYANTTGTQNTASGYQALYANTTGSSNTASGMQALVSNTTGTNNTASGYQALYANTTGTQNTASGYQALYANTTGSSNTASGMQALVSNTTGTENTANGVSALYANTTGTNNTASGYQALYSNTTGTNNTASGYQALKFNTTGNYNTASGYAALLNNTTGTSNTASGYAALISNTTGNYNTASGLQSLYSNTTGNYNTASGLNALFSNTTASNNTASGYEALYSNTTGTQNAASGYQALYSNTTASNNTASGYQALYSNTTGTENTANGVSALDSNTTGNYNTASGVNALNSNTTGANNTASGVSALHSNTTGNYNTASGVLALYNNTTGSSNVASGYQALYNNTTGSGNTTLNPLTSALAYAPVFNPTVENDRFCMGSTAVTNAYIQVAWTVVSDARDKIDFAPVPHGLDFVCKLQPTAYRYKIDREAEEGHGPVRYGFKAQDVLALEGDTPVIVDAEDADKLRFNDQSMIAVLVNAIKELKAEIDSLKSQLNGA
jgi:trimeric autotransporter adhesin